MSGGWIKFEKSLLTDPRVRRMVKALFPSELGQVSKAHGALVVGCLVTLWCHADEHIDDADVLALGLDDVDDLVGVPGFAAAMPADWLQVLDAESVKLPDFHAHNGSVSKRKAQAVQRQLSYRERVRGPIITDSERVLTVVRQQGVDGRALTDQDLDQDQDHKDPTAVGAPASDAIKAKGRGEPGVERMMRSGEFGGLWAIYPARAGDPKRRAAARAISARLSDGATWPELEAGARRYAAYVRGTGREGSEYVKTAAAFFGPERSYLLPWNVPAKPSSGNGREPPKDPDVELRALARQMGLLPQPGEPEGQYTARCRAWNVRRVEALG